MKTSNNDFLEELRGTFLEEATEMIHNLEVLFLQYEANPQDAETLQAIFRNAHTLKGSAKSVSFNEFANFAHQVENLLTKINKNEIIADGEVIDVLLAANDKMRLWIEGLHKDKDYRLDTAEEVARMLNLNGNHSPAAAAPPPPPQAWGMFDDTPEEKKVEAKVNRIADKTDESIRLTMGKIDGLLDLFGEQVILQATLEQVRRDDPTNHEQTDAIITQLSKMTYDLQRTAMSLRMVSLSGLFHKMQRIIRDTAKALDKRIEIEGEGEDTELDKVVVDELSGAVTHLLRNAVDHGIETENDRKALGKNPVAKVSIHASQENGRFVLRVADDGRGLDKAKIVQKAREKGLIAQDAQLSDDEIHALIFKSGFSTANSVTDVSGRGVGMDAVKSVVERLRGVIDLQSKPGVGTTFTIRLPLSMAIFNGMVFRLWDERYILPSREIREIISYQSQDVQRLEEGRLMILKGEKPLPFLNVKRTLQQEAGRKVQAQTQRRVALVVRKDNREFALEVDEVLGQQRVVLKKLGRELENFPNVSGGAILGDGRVAMILNLDSIGT